MSRSCADCGCQISSQGNRCKSCANRLRWNGDDPRRAKLVSRNVVGRSDNTPYTDREWLRIRYEDRALSLRQIAQEAACGVRTIARWMRLHRVQTRDNATASRARDRNGAANPKWRGGPPRCRDCGREISRAQNVTRCASCERADRAGTKNPNWRGGVTHENALARRSPRYRAWRASVFERDSYACQRCGDSRGGNLVAHHVQYWSKAPDLRYTVSNGLTLCDPCHRREHAIPCPPNKRTTVGGTKLTDEQRAELRRQYEAGDVTQRRLALRFRVSEATVSRLVRSL